MQQFGRTKEKDKNKRMPENDGKSDQKNLIVYRDGGVEETSLFCDAN